MNRAAQIIHYRAARADGADGQAAIQIGGDVRAAADDGKLRSVTTSGTSFGSLPITRRSPHLGAGLFAPADRADLRYPARSWAAGFGCRSCSSAAARRGVGMRQCSVAVWWWSWSGFEDQVEGGLGRAAESAEAGLGEHLPQLRFPRLGAEAEADLLGERVRGADGR